MELFIQGVEDVLTRKISKHGIIHGLDSFRGYTVKVVVLTPECSETPPEPELDLPYSGVVENENVVRGEIGTYPVEEEQEIPHSDIPDTTSRMRKFIKS